MQTAIPKPHTAPDHALWSRVLQSASRTSGSWKIGLGAEKDFFNTIE